MARKRSWLALIAALAIGLPLIAIETIHGASPERAAGGIAILVAFGGAVVAFQFRSETVATYAGKPVDERWQLINERAVAASGVLAGIVSIVGFAAAEVAGQDNWQFALIACVVAFGYMGAVVWYRFRL